MDIYLCLFFIIFWILPLFYTNLTKSKITFFPRFIAGLYSTSNLFTKANFIWPMPYIQVKTEKNGEWITIPQDEYFQMETFGYRTRLFEALYLATDDKQAQNGVYEQLAQWIAGRYAQLHLNTKVVTVRFVAGLHRNDPDNLPQERWRHLPIETFSNDDIYVISQHVVRE